MRRWILFLLVWTVVRSVAWGGTNVVALFEYTEYTVRAFEGSTTYTSDFHSVSIPRSRYLDKFTYTNYVWLEDDIYLWSPPVITGHHRSS